MTKITKPKIGNSPAFAGASRLRQIEGRHNPLLRELRKAFSRGEPSAEGYCAIEGLRILEEAIRSGVRFRAVFFSHSAENKAQRLLPQIAAQVETLILPDKLFADAVPSESPQGVAALVRCRQFSVDDVLEHCRQSPLVAIVGLQDPGNLGTILRSAEAFEAGGVILVEGTVSPFNPKVVRASAGSVFRLPVAQAKLTDCIGKMRERGLRLVATSSHKGTPLPEANLSGPLAVLIGGEGGGIPREIMAAMDEVLAIPHSSKVESLNAGVAASIVLYEIRKQRS